VASRGPVDRYRSSGFSISAWGWGWGSWSSTRRITARVRRRLRQARRGSPVTKAARTGIPSPSFAPELSLHPRGFSAAATLPPALPIPGLIDATPVPPDYRWRPPSHAPLPCIAASAQPPPASPPFRCPPPPTRIPSLSHRPRHSSPRHFIAAHTPVLSACSRRHHSRRLPAILVPAHHPSPRHYRCPFAVCSHSSCFLEPCLSAFLLPAILPSLSPAPEPLCLFLPPRLTSFVFPLRSSSFLLSVASSSSSSFFFSRPSAPFFSSCLQSLPRFSCLRLFLFSFSSPSLLSSLLFFLFTSLSALTPSSSPSSSSIRSHHFVLTSSSVLLSPAHPAPFLCPNFPFLFRLLVPPSSVSRKPQCSYTYISSLS
jgi:hypothetical protein